MHTDNIIICKSIILPESLKKIILKNYYFKTLNEIKLINTGDNDHYLVDCGIKKYILRIYRSNKHWLSHESNYLFELEWLLFLYKNKVPVSCPIPRKDGKYLNKLNAPEGIRYWALFSEAFGTVKKLDYKNSYKFGEIIAKLHIVSNNFITKNQRKIIDKNFLINLSLARIIKNAKNNYQFDIRYLISICKKINLIISKFETTFIQDEWGLIGGDFHQENHFVDDAGKITLFDFDLCGYGWRAYDLAVFKWSLFSINNIKLRTKNCKNLWQAFLKGYDNYRHLSKSELAIINTFVQARQIWVMGSLTTYPDIVLNDNYWKRMMAGLKEAEILPFD